jgi:hypothetical protein
MRFCGQAGSYECLGLVEQEIRLLLAEQSSPRSAMESTTSEEADQGVGRGPGGPPHKICESLKMLSCGARQDTANDRRRISNCGGDFVILRRKAGAALFLLQTPGSLPPLPAARSHALCRQEWRELVLAATARRHPERRSAARRRSTDWPHAARAAGAARVPAGCDSSRMRRRWRTTSLGRTEMAQSLRDPPILCIGPAGPPL